jgi:hypothetical protein
MSTNQIAGTQTNGIEAGIHRGGRREGSEETPVSHAVHIQQSAVQPCVHVRHYYSSLPYFLPSFIPFFLSFFLSSLLPSFLPSFLPSYRPIKSLSSRGATVVRVVQACTSVSANICSLGGLRSTCLCARGCMSSTSAMRPLVGDVRVMCGVCAPLRKYVLSAGQ